MTRWWCEHAVLPGGTRHGVTIATDGDRITSVTPDTRRAPDAAALWGVTIPGLANSHSHAFHRALRSRTQAGTGSFWTWRDVMYEAAARLDPDRYHRLACAVFAEMALAGQTAVGEFHYVHHQPDGTPYDNPNAMGEALLAAATEAGIRITLLDTIYLHGGLASGGYVVASGAQRRYRDADVDAWAERTSALPTAADQRVGAAIHSVRAVDPGSMAAVVAWCDDHDAPLHAHVSEQVAENGACLDHYGRTPTALLADAGALGPRFSAVHATHLTDADIAALGSTGSTVCLCPTTERDLGDGIGPSAELVDAGVALHLGSDSHAVIDHFEEARAVELDERLRSRQRGIHQVEALLAMATVNGHRALGWADAGELVAGQRADLVTVRLDTVRAAGAPTELAAATLVFASTAADITSVISGGRPIVTDGHHHTLDTAAALAASIKELFA